METQETQSADTLPPPPVEIGQGWWRTTVGADTVVYLASHPDAKDSAHICVAAGPRGVSVHTDPGGRVFDSEQAVVLMTIIAIATEQHGVIRTGQEPYPVEHDAEELARAQSYVDSIKS